MPMDFAPIFQQVFQTSALPTLLVSHNGTVLAVSDSLQVLLGYTATDLQGKSIQSLVSENSLGWQSIVENQQPTSISVTMHSADGKTALVQLQITPVRIAQDSDPIWNVNLNPAPLSDLSHSDLFSGRGQYLEKVLQTITDGFLVINKNGDVLFCNQSAAQIMRVNSSDELIGKNIWQRVPELNVLKQYPGYDLVFQQNQPARFKEYFPGYNFWMEISAYPSEDNVVVYFKDVNDVVKFKKIQSLERDVLAMNANPYKELPEVLDFYITSLEKIYNGLVMMLWKVENDRLLQWSANSVPESIIAACSRVAIHHDQYIFSRAASEKKRLVIDQISANANQDARAQLLQEAGFVALSANPIILSSGDVVGVLEVFYTDQQHNLLEEPGTIERTVNLLHVLLENKLAQENIRLSNQRYDLITKATNDIIWEWDMVKGLLIKANAGFSDFFGTGPGQLSLSFNAWKKLLHPDDFYRVISKRNLALRNHDNPYWEDEFRMVNLSGKYNYFYHKAYIVRNAAGKAIRLIGATQNITRRKDDEALMIELNNRLKQRADELAASNVELERFAYVASHDMQEPLRMITSFLQLFKKKYQNQIDETAEQYLHFVMDGADRMKRLITDLLEYSRIGSNKGVLEPIDTAALMQEVEEVFVNRIAECEATIICKGLPVIRGNKTQLFQLFQNLVGNALKYVGNEKPVVIVQGLEEEQQFLFSVSDNGIGIKPMFFEKIFVLFQRLHHKHQYGGTGIGLSVCKKIVEKHGGKIWVTSEPDQGSTFYFTISKEIEEQTSFVP
jgi:two-component system CheB/CheR fusion protein